MGRDSLIVIKGGGNVIDVSELINKVTWGGRRGAAARHLAVTFIDDDGYAHDRTGIDVEKGHRCVYYRDGAELFRGLFMRQGQSRSKTMAVTAYDNGIYLANNKDTFNYTNKTATEIFADCCTRFGIPYSEAADIVYRIPELPKPKTTAWDVISDALSLTYKATGRRYYVMCVNGELRLVERRMNIVQWVIETGSNLEDYQMTKSIENVRTRVKLLSKEGAVLAEAADGALEAKIGKFQDVDGIRDEMNTAQLNELTRSILNEKNKPEQTFTVSALGQKEVIAGIGVFIVIKELGISKTFYVEEDTHTFDGNYHNMKLKLVLAQDAAM